jgi:hypothetical protein
MAPAPPTVPSRAALLLSTLAGSKLPRRPRQPPPWRSPSSLSPVIPRRRAPRVGELELERSGGGCAVLLRSLPGSGAVLEEVELP